MDKRPQSSSFLGGVVQKIMAAVMIVVGFCIVFFTSSRSAHERGLTGGNVAHADVPPSCTGSGGSGSSAGSGGSGCSG